MPDRFEALRLSAAPSDPDPAFAAGLRARIERALELKGVTVSQLVPYIAVSGALEAIDFYERAFGAVVDAEPIVMPDGRVGHAELRFGGRRLMISDAHPEIGVTAPRPGEAPVTIYLDVSDVDAVIDRAVSEGAELLRPAATYDHGRNGVIRDPFGHRWMIASEPATTEEAPAPGTPRHGDLGYASLFVADAEQAAGFFASVLGWRYGPADGPDGRHVEGQTLTLGLWGGIEQPTLFCSFAVEDLDAALETVVHAGGGAGEVTNEPFGRAALCTDDQGARFGLYEPPGGPAPSGAAALENGRRHGDLAYVTMEVVDSSRARAFYGAVLGWSFVRGHVPDGWQAVGPSPMFGMAGGMERATTLPMYRVDDIAAAVEAVRAGGGSSTDPEPRPYGVSAECGWEGLRFYLGQL